MFNAVVQHRHLVLTRAKAASTPHRIVTQWNHAALKRGPSAANAKQRRNAQSTPREGAIGDVHGTCDVQIGRHAYTLPLFVRVWTGELQRFVRASFVRLQQSQQFVENERWIVPMDRFRDTPCGASGRS